MVRIKNRYIVAQLLWNSGPKEKFNEIGIKDLQVLLREKIIELYGDVGVGEFGSSSIIKFFDIEHSKILVLKTTRDGEHDVRFVLSCMTKVKEVEICIRSLTIKSCTRTCTEALKECLRVYFEKAGAKIEDNERKLNALYDSLAIVEL